MDWVQNMKEKGGGQSRAVIFSTACARWVSLKEGRAGALERTVYAERLK